MSLIGKKSAIISLGTACQTAFQLRAHAGLLSEVMGDDLVPSRLPFDWTLVPPAIAARWLNSGEPFPGSPEALVPVEGWPDAFSWPKHGVEFWHDFRTPQGVDLAATFAQTRDMYQRHFHKLEALGKLDRVIAVISNTQNNLPNILPDEARLVYRRQDVVQLKAAFEKTIGRSCRMLCVTYSDRRAPGFVGMPKHDITVKWIARDATQWQGSRGRWQRALTDYLANND